MLRAIKYELRPNATQRSLIDRTCGCRRFVYNNALIKHLPQLKVEYEWLKEVPSQALQQLWLQECPCQEPEHP